MESKIKRTKNLFIFGIVFVLVAYALYVVFLQAGVFFDLDNEDFATGLAAALTLIYVTPFYGVSVVLALVAYICSLVASKKMLKGDYLQNKKLVTAIVFNSISMAFCLVGLFFGILFSFGQGLYVLAHFIFLIITLASICGQRRRMKDKVCLESEQEEIGVVVEAVLDENSEE